MMKLGKNESRRIINQGYKACSYYDIGINVLIYDFEYGIDDCVLWNFSDSDIVNKSKISYSKEGNPFFRGGYCGRHKFWLNDFIKKGI